LRIVDYTKLFSTVPAESRSNVLINKTVLSCVLSLILSLKLCHYYCGP